ncbi:MAG TPA: PA2169 family four-helix-bundle protein [Azospirillaceae bacterium]|nr:PA2169 family four-helix-bundle protein [Azospirillaceae bacterium]
MTRDEVIDTLNDLIQITEDSHEGYRKAAEDSDDQDLKLLFNDLSAQRGAMVRDLQTLVAAEGGAPEASGTMLGSAHRFFLDLKSTVLGRNRQTIIREVERGESEAARRYEQALERDLPPNLSLAVAQHLARLRADRDRVAALTGTGA